LPPEIGQARAERIARSHACEHCLEYSFKKLVVRAASPTQREEQNVVWLVDRICGVCGLQQELALDPEGEVVYIA
jgi:hypothetical protein